MATAYEQRNMAPSLLSGLNRAAALGLTGFPFASYAAFKAAYAALFTGSTLAAVNKPIPRQLAVDVDKELDKQQAAGLIPVSVYGAASLAAARTAIQGFFAPSGSSGVLSTNHAGPFLGG